MTTAMVMLTRNEARALTKRIQTTGADLAELILKAHDGEAWRAMRYESWTAYVDGEFAFSRQHSYKLLNQGRVNAALAAAGSTERATVTEAAEVSHYATPVTDITNDSAIQERVIETLSEVRRGGPAPKPVGKRRRGFQTPDEKVRHYRDEFEGWLEQMDEETVFTPQFVRSIEGLRDIIDSMLGLAEAASRRPRRIDEYSA